jgi:flagellar protein FliL
VAKDKEKIANQEGPNKKSLISRVIPVLIITILAGGGGYLQGSIVRVNPVHSTDKKEVGTLEEKSVNSEANADELHGQESALSDQTIVRSLAPVVSNLGTPSDTWMRLELSILMSSAASSEQDLVAAKAGESVVAFLRTVDLKKIEGPSGFLHFREDLSDMLTARFSGSISGVLIGSMVVE